MHRDNEGWMHMDLATGRTTPVPRDQVFDQGPAPAGQQADPGGPEILGQQPVNAMQRAVGDRLATLAGYMPKRDAAAFVNRRATQMFGPSPDAGIAAQIHRGR